MFVNAVRDAGHFVDRVRRWGDPGRDTRLARSGSELAGYRLGAVAGEGATAVVYRSRHRATGAESAVKVWRWPLTPAVRGQFLRECRFHWALSENPNVTRLFCASSPNDRVLWSAQELMNESLAERLRGGLVWRGRTAIDMAVQLVRAVEAVHAAGIVHRDVNPRNVMLVDDRLALTDLGSAQYEQYPRQDAAAGSPPFVAPELFDGARPSPSTDLYSTAMTVSTMLPPDAPDAVARAVCLAKAADPRDRRMTLREFRLVLEQATS